jgi:plastocyanin
MSTLRFALLAAAAVLMSFAPIALADGAKIEVKFTGKAPAMAEINRKSDPVCAKVKAKDEEVLVSEGGLENVVVRVTKGAPSAPGTGEVHVEQHECTYRPRVSGAVAGQTIVVKNTDETLHNIHTYVGQKTLFNKAQPPKTPDVKSELKPKDKNSVIRFKCDVHPWMTAFVVVNDNPYITVTDKKGSATLDKLPPGTYTIEAFHERYGVKTAEATVEAGKTADVKIEYTGNEPKPAL